MKVVDLVEVTKDKVWVEFSLAKSLHNTGNAVYLVAIQNEYRISG